MTPRGNDALAPAHYDSDPPQGMPPRRSRRGLVVLAAVVVVLVIGIVLGIRSRVVAETELARTTDEAAVPSVNIVHPEQNAPNEEIVLPGNIQAYTDTPLYARTSGYLRRWYFDIGARVKQGDLLAEIDTPEVDEQLRQARADLSTAEANLHLADITAKRNEELLKSRSISTQERDNATGVYAADKGMVTSKQADVARLERLQSYEKIFAPFDGIVTARNTDTGALIDAGANSAARELFHLSAIDKVRVFAAIPETYSRSIHAGAAVTVTLDEYAAESFHGTLVRTANAIDPSARTLLVEVDVDNTDGRLLPGAFANVHLSLPSDVQTATVTVPSNTVLFRKEGLRIAVVRDGKAVLMPITIGRDYGDKVEVVSGLKASEELILDPSDSLLDGTPVRTEQPAVVGTAQ
jgi:RND family efflux transporter MFP subunit